jgi:hypothetical protein
MKYKLCLLLFTCTFMSCEYVYNYKYIVTNATDKPIEVSVKTYLKDSTFVILKDSVKIVISKGHGIEGSRGPYFQDVKEDLYLFTVTKDKLLSKKDFLKNSSWRFEKGDYSTQISNEDF